MEELLNEFMSLKNQIASGDIPLEQAVLELSKLLDKLNSKTDKEVTISKALMSDYSLRNLVEKNKMTQERIKKLNKVILLQELGFSFTEHELSVLLGTHSTINN